MIPANVIREDHELEAATSRASEDLARLRWRWTLDDSNADRVSIREYARSVGRAFATVYKYVNGYALRLADRDISINEAIERAGMGAETQAVTEAVAEARGLTFSTTRQERGTEVRHVRNLAREAAERKGTTVAEEAVTIAQMAARIDESESQRKVEREARRTLRYVEMQGYLHSAIRSLQRAAAMGGSWDGEEQELLRDTVDKVREIIVLLDARIMGTQAIDWDAELAAIMSGVAEA